SNIRLQGQFQQVSLADSEPIDAIAMGASNELWILKSGLRMVQVGVPPQVPPRPAFTWSRDVRITDLAYDSDSRVLCLLDPFSGTVWMWENASLPQDPLSLSDLPSRSVKP